MESVNIDVNRPKPQAENNICSLSVVWGICYSGGGGGGIKSVNKCGLQNMVSYQRLPSINFSLQSLSLKWSWGQRDGFTNKVLAMQELGPKFGPPNPSF